MSLLTQQRRKSPCFCNGLRQQIAAWKFTISCIKVNEISSYIFLCKSHFEPYSGKQKSLLLEAGLKELIQG